MKDAARDFPPNKEASKKGNRTATAADGWWSACSSIAIRYASNVAGRIGDGVGAMATTMRSAFDSICRWGVAVWGDEREKGAGSATEASSRTVEHATSSGMHNPNMAPSPFAHETMEMVAVNVNGDVYIEERPNTRGGAAEAGTAMMYEPTEPEAYARDGKSGGGGLPRTQRDDTRTDRSALFCTCMDAR